VAYEAIWSLGFTLGQVLGIYNNGLSIGIYPMI